MRTLKTRKVAGILRIKNDAAFIERCIRSCISALDELIIVYNDCIDNSAEEIEKMRSIYPDKIKVYEYTHKVYGANLDYATFEMAKQLPDDSPHLLCNYYNFALSKVTCEYAMKIDADQIYFTDELIYWCDFVRDARPMGLSIKAIFGALFQKYLSAYRALSLKIGRILPLMPECFVKACYPSYLEYAKYLFSHDKACLSMAGINVFEAQATFVTLGKVCPEINILPPFNGEGDHVIFKVSDKTSYEKFEMPYYNIARTSSYSLIEEFKHPYRIMFIGYFWLHISSMRSGTVEKVAQVKKSYPESFLKINQLADYTFNKISNRSDKQIFRTFQQILFSFIYKANRTSLKKRFHD